MFNDIEEFLLELDRVSTELFTGAEINIIYERIDKASVRIILNPRLFIDIYVNTDTDRYDFSLIKGNKRIFGYDNLGGWHCHPVNNPERHVECKEPTLKKVFEDIAKVVSKSSDD